MRRQPRERPWVVIFILLSLLAHLLFVVAIVLISHFLPAPKLKSAPQEMTTVSLSLQTPPPPKLATPPPKPKHVFMPTNPDAEAKHQNTLVESDNDTRLRSQSQSARLPDSVMPDVDAKREHASDLRDAPNAPNKKSPQAPSPAQSQQQQKSEQPPQPTQQTPPQTAQADHATPPSPAKQPVENPVHTPTKQTAKQLLDPNGLPILPPIDAPTMAPRTQRQEATPASSISQIAQNVHGAVGTHGEDSPAAMATELGRYKAKVYRAVGQRWYDKVDAQLQVLPAGMVHIQFTIHKDGSVETKVLSGDTSDLQLLLSISMNSIREAAPFDPFTDSMIKQVGDSYTDDFSFSIYGQ